MSQCLFGFEEEGNNLSILYILILFLFSLQYNNTYNRLLQMNQLHERHQQASPQTSENKIKLNQLSKYIFDVIYQKRQILDVELMKLMVSQFGSVKQQTLKRRKYDTVNILHKADIILIQKKDNTFLYSMKHDVPNSIKDLEQIKSKAQEIQKRIEQKKNLIKMMRTARGNYKRLMQVNQVRIKDEKNAIELPIVAVVQTFTDYTSDHMQQKQTIKMKFPAGAKFINNMFAHSEIFNI